MSSGINSRKLEHIHIIQADEDVDRQKNYFDRVQLIHRALPEIDLDNIDTSTTFLGKQLGCPLLISSMTGGDHEVIKKINRNLAVAAEAMEVAIGVGSQRVMFTNPDARASFAVREQAPNTLVFANIGAVQLNKGYDISHCREAVEVTGADGLYLHLNPLQEAIQPEGDTCFAGLASKIGDVAQNLEVPVILKEVGAGFSIPDVQFAMENHVRIIDVAGSGGTSWSRIEHHRAAETDDHDMGMRFQDWGVPTPVALQQLSPFKDRIQLIASGGIRSGIDMAKAVILGADLVGLASPFLKPAMESPGAVVETIKGIQREFRTAMFLLGIDKVEDLKGNTDLLL